MQAGDQKKRGGGEALTALVLFLLLSIGAPAANAQEGGGSSGGGSGSTGTTQDKNDTDPQEIRQNYLKRFPFAKEAANSDRVQNQDSSEGSSQTFSKALDSVTTRCDFFTGSMGVGDIHYQQQTQQGSVETATQRDNEVTKNTVNTYGLPMSDTQYQVIDRENRQRLLEMAFDPERWVWSNEATDQLMASSMSNSVGGAAQTSFKGAFDAINTVLINVANENAAAPGGSSGGRSIPQAVYLVLQFYHRFFIPLAIILLLPGALLTQLKGMIGFGFLGGDEDAVTPFDGIFRAVIAVFLIPATQLIMSYCIDIGNVLAETVRDPAKNWVNEQTLMNWAREQMFVAPPDKANNAIVTFGGGGAGLNGGAGAGGAGGGGGSQSGGGGQSGQTGQSGGFIFNFNIFGPQGAPSSNDVLNQILQFFFGPFAGGQNQGGVPAGGGKAAGQPSSATVQENQLFLSTTMQLGFNSASYLMSYGLTVLTAYQLVFMCYLLLMGPIAASFFAWPSGVGSLFRKVFSNWLNAVIVLSLWRFYWCIILACMTQRIVYLQQSGGFNPNSPSEMMIFNCFMALLVYVPFQPFNFNPGEAVSSVLDKAGQGGGGGGGGGGQGAPGATPAGSEVEHGGKAAPQHGAVRRGGMATKEFVSVAVRGFTAVQSAFSGGRGAPEALTGAESSPPSAGERAAVPSGGQASASPPTSVVSQSGQPVNVHSQSQEQALPPASGSQDAVSSPAGEFSSPPLETLQAGAPPMVPLVPTSDGGAAGQRYLIATNDVSQVGPAMQAWQQAIGSAPAQPVDSSGTATQVQSFGGAAGVPSDSGVTPSSSPTGGTSTSSSPGSASKGLAGTGGSPMSGSGQSSAGGQPSSGKSGQPAGGGAPPLGNTPSVDSNALPPTTSPPTLPSSGDSPPPGSNPPPTDPPKTT